MRLPHVQHQSFACASFPSEKIDFNFVNHRTVFCLHIGLCKQVDERACVVKILTNVCGLGLGRLPKSGIYETKRSLEEAWIGREAVRCIINSNYMGT